MMKKKVVEYINPNSFHVAKDFPLIEKTEPIWISKSASEGLGWFFFFFLSKFHSFTKIFLLTITAHPTPSHSLSITFSRQLLILMNWHLKLIVWHKTTSKLAFIFCQSLHKAYRRVCCKEPLSFGWRITSLVSFGFAPCNLHCYGKPLDLDRAQNHWGQHNRVWQVPFSNLFGSKIKIPGKVDPWSIEISYTALKTDVVSEHVMRCGIYVLIWTAPAEVGRLKHQTFIMSESMLWAIKAPAMGLARYNFGSNLETIINMGLLNFSTVLGVSANSQCFG